MFPATTEYFYKNKSSKDGLDPYCKEDKKRRSRLWETNPDNNEKLRANKVRNNQKPNVKRVKKINNERRRKEGKFQEYYYNNPSKYQGYREERKHKIHEISETEWQCCKDYFLNECAYCGLHISEHFNYYAKNLIWTDFHKEHVDDEGSNNLSNCVPSCKSCNCQKWSYSLDEWYNIRNSVFQVLRLDKINKWLYEDYKKYIENEVHNEIPSK
jgi:hypothetical protein